MDAVGVVEAPEGGGSELLGLTPGNGVEDGIHLGRVQVLAHHLGKLAQSLHRELLRVAQLSSALLFVAQVVLRGGRKPDSN